MVLLLYMLLLIPGGFYPFYFLNLITKIIFFIFHIFFCLWWRGSTWMGGLHRLAGFLFYIFK